MMGHQYGIKLPEATPMLARLDMKQMWLFLWTDITKASLLEHTTIHHRHFSSYIALSPHLEYFLAEDCYVLLSIDKVVLGW